MDVNNNDRCVPWETVHRAFPAVQQLHATWSLETGKETGKERVQMLRTQTKRGLLCTCAHYMQIQAAAPPLHYKAWHASAASAARSVRLSSRATV